MRVPVFLIGNINEIGVMTSSRKPAILRNSPRSRSQIVRRICEKLTLTYGHPQLGNPRNPLDDLIFIILSNRTSPATALATYKKLKRVFKTWGEINDAPYTRLKRILKPAGLAGTKTKQVRNLLKKIKTDFGSCSLRKIKYLSEEDVESYLVSLPGVSLKVAKCVMMYTMGFQVLPVDVHVHRITTRLGWTCRKRADQCHEELERLVPSHRRFGFHVGSILHGRKICRSSKPLCRKCIIQSYCEYNGRAT